MPDGRLEEVRPLGIFDQVYFLFALTQGKGRRLRIILRPNGGRTNWNIPYPFGASICGGVITNAQRATRTHGTNEQNKQNPEDRALEPRRTNRKEHEERETQRAQEGNGRRKTPEKDPTLNGQMKIQEKTKYKDTK